MEIIYSKNDLKDLIQKYYLEMEGRNVEVILTSKNELVGYYGTNTCVTTITLKENVNILDRSITVKKEINKEDLYNILKTMLESEGYILSTLEFDEGIKSECVGYFMNEHTEYKPYFNGVILNVRKNSLTKKM